jgi:hypothetical protein
MVQPSTFNVVIDFENTPEETIKELQLERQFLEIW